MLVGGFVLFILIDALWALLGEEKERQSKLTIPTDVDRVLKILLGLLERFLYTTAIVKGQPQWIPFWLSFKLAVSWQSFVSTEKTASHNVFLIGNALSVIFGFCGAQIILLF